MRIFLFNTQPYLIVVRGLIKNEFNNTTHIMISIHLRKFYNNNIIKLFNFKKTCRNYYATTQEKRSEINNESYKKMIVDAGIANEV